MKVQVRGIRLVAAATLLLAVGACGAGEGGSSELGFKISEEATPRNVGLPAYPGSKPYKGDDDSSAADIGISTPLFGLKVVAVELEAPDEPEKVAAFYRKALAKYGEVVECIAGRDGADERSDRSDRLTCDSDEMEKNSVVYKVGTEKNQRVVAIKPLGRGTQFSLVHVNVRGDD